MELDQTTPNLVEAMAAIGVAVLDAAGYVTARREAMFSALHFHS